MTAHARVPLASVVPVLTVRHTVSPATCRCRVTGMPATSVEVPRRVTLPVTVKARFLIARAVDEVIAVAVG